MWGLIFVVIKVFIMYVLVFILLIYFLYLFLYEYVINIFKKGIKEELRLISIWFVMVIIFYFFKRYDIIIRFDEGDL